MQSQLKTCLQGEITNVNRESRILKDEKRNGLSKTSLMISLGVLTFNLVD